MIDRFGNWYADYPGQQPWQDPTYVRIYGQQQQPTNTQQQGQAQMLTPPTIDAKIIQVDSIEAIDRFPMAAGTSQMYMTKDEQNIVVRSMYANGQHNDDVYDKRPPAPPVPTLNPADYVRKDELQALIADALQAHTAPHKAATKKEEAA